MISIRCEGTMHARFDPDSQTLEVKCKRRRCGAGPGVVVLHTFSLPDGELVKTHRLADPLTTERMMKSDSS